MEILRKEGIWEESRGKELNFTLLLEEISREDPTLGLWLLGQRSFCLPQLYMFGSRLQKKRFGERLSSGEDLGLWDIQGEFFWDSSASLRAEKKEGRWFLKGKKLFWNDISRADVVMMTAETEPHGGKEGHSVFILDDVKKSVEKKRITRSEGEWEVTFKNIEIPAEHLIGEIGKAYKQTAKIKQEAHVALAGMGLGITAGALDSILEKGTSSKQKRWGEVQKKAAHGLTNLEACRFLTYRAAFQKDQKRGSSVEAEYVKSLAGRMARKSSLYALQFLTNQKDLKDGVWFNPGSSPTEEEREGIQRYFISNRVYRSQKS